MHNLQAAHDNCLWKWRKKCHCEHQTRHFHHATRHFHHKAWLSHQSGNFGGREGTIPYRSHSCRTAVWITNNLLLFWHFFLSKVDCARLKAFTNFLALYNGEQFEYHPFIVQIKMTVRATRWLNVNNLSEPEDELDKLKNLNKQFKGLQQLMSDLAITCHFFCKNRTSKRIRLESKIINRGKSSMRRKRLDKTIRRRKKKN